MWSVYFVKVVVRTLKQAYVALIFRIIILYNDCNIINKKDLRKMKSCVDFNLDMNMILFHVKHAGCLYACKDLFVL